MIDRREILTVGAAMPLLAAVPTPRSGAPVDLVIDGAIRLADVRSLRGGRVTMAAADDGVTVIGIADQIGGLLPPDGELGLRVGAVPGLAVGVQLWRYAPWKAWTRPIQVSRVADVRADDVQLFYWRTDDGSIVVAVPLSGAGFRTTLGQVEGRLAVRAVAGASSSIPAALPLLAVGHGRDAHAVIAASYRAALAAMGKTDHHADAKRLPAELHYLGWNSWNASNLGKDLDAKLMLDAATRLRAAGVPVGWMLVDDGYFDHRDQRLRGFEPDRTKFPDGFAPLIARLKREYGIRSVGAWLALDGYWHGIDPASPLGKTYADDLFTWSEPRDPANPTSPSRTNSFIRPDRPAMPRYYDAHLGALRAAGFDFVKIDNQLVVERMAKRNFPIWQLATAMHDGANAAVLRHFDDTVINCMDLTADAYFNFGTTPVARAVEDYFPYKSDETYNLEKGNAAAHVLQAIYNALYVSQVAIPDFDMFETTNPNARLHAIARAANNGPIYVTDLPGRHDAALLKSMTLSDGRILRADRPLLPCPECLFQLQAAMPFKAFSGIGKAGLLMIANLADTERVTGRFSGSDLPGFSDHTIVAWEHLSGRFAKLPPGATIPVSLGRFEAELWSLHDSATGFAAFGRIDKINGLAAIGAVERGARGHDVTLLEGGPFAAFVAVRPDQVTTAGKAVPWTWRDGLLRVDAAPGAAAATIRIIHA